MLIKNNNIIIIKVILFRLKAFFKYIFNLIKKVIITLNNLFFKYILYFNKYLIITLYLIKT